MRTLTVMFLIHRLDGMHRGVQVHFFLFSMPRVTHNTKVESTFLNFNWLQVWLLYCPHRLLPQVCINTNYRSITCLKSNYILTFWQGANNFVQSIFEFCVKFDQVWHFFSVFFLCCCSANKNNKHVNTKTFAIGTNFWENCCIFWQNCKGVDIFGHDCMHIWGILINS